MLNDRGGSGAVSTPPRSTATSLSQGMTALWSISLVCLAPPVRVTHSTIFVGSKPCNASSSMPGALSRRLTQNTATSPCARFHTASTSTTGACALTGAA